MFLASLYTGILHTSGTKYSLNETESLAAVGSFILLFSCVIWKREDYDIYLITIYNFLVFTHCACFGKFTF